MKFTEQQVYDALVASVAENPTGASAIDVLSQLGFYGTVNDMLYKLSQDGKLKQTSPGNYLPASSITVSK